MKYVFTFVLVFISSTATADWNAIVTTDGFTDEEVRMVVYEDENVRLQYSMDEFVLLLAVADAPEPGRTETLFVYVTSKQGLFEPKTKMEWRVDSNPVRVDKHSSSPLIKTNAFSWSPSTLKISMVGFGGDGCSNFLKQLLTGNELKGRYHISQTGQKSFAISLDGIREAFSEAFSNHQGIQVCLAEK